MTPPLVSVGLVTWNSAGDLPNCLKALAAQTYLNVEYIVVDNASGDDSLRIIAQSIPQATVIRNQENRGFCGGHNQAIHASHGEYYLPLNPDVILEPGYIAIVVEQMRRDMGVGMAATRLYLGTPEDQPRRFDSTGLFLDRKRRQYLRGFREVDTGQYDRTGEVFGVDGAAPIYLRAMLEDISVDGEYFDELFHSHKEDVDLAWRARILGWRCVYIPGAVAYHRRTFQPGRRKGIAAEVRFHAVKNRYLLLLKNESKAGWQRDGFFILLYDVQILVYLLFFERHSLQAFVTLRRNWARIQRWRREIALRAKVPPQEQLGWFQNPTEIKD